MTVESLEKNIRAGMFFYKDGVWISKRPDGCIPDGYRPAEMPGPYRFYVDESNLIIFYASLRGERSFAETLFRIKFRSGYEIFESGRIK